MFRKHVFFAGSILLGHFLAWPAIAFQSSNSGVSSAAQAALFAARYEQATALYRQQLSENPAEADGYYGLVRALLKSHRSPDAYAAAEQALRNASGTAAAEAAAGMASLRKGDVGRAETYFRSAYKRDPKYPGALAGLASIYSMVSKFKTARDLRLAAYAISPNDPELMIAHANTLKGPAHLAALEQAFVAYDPESEEARNLRLHIQSDRALGDRKLRRLVSPYQAGRVKLYWIHDGPNRIRGAGIHVQVNQRQTVRLLLDTGASGISLSPGTAEKAGLEMLNVDSGEAKGIGDERPQESQLYLASEIRAGDVAFADVPVSIFRSARSADYDGLIGADVFQRFLMTIDFPNLELTLEPRPGGQRETPEEPQDAADTPAVGFHRVLRFGNHLAIFTSVNQEEPRLFLIDSGSSGNLIDASVARESTSVSKDDRTVVRGIQGKVNETSRARSVVLVFAGFRQDNSDLIAFNFDKMNDSMAVGLAGVLGLPVVAQLKLTIDYWEGTVRFERGK